MLWLSLALASVVDRVVAVVDAEVVLMSDDALIRELAPHSTSPFWAREEAAVEAALLRSAAGDLALYRPTPQQVEAEIQRLRLAFGERWSPFRARWKLGDEQLRSLVHRRLIVEAWLARNLTVSANEAGAYQREIETWIRRLEQRLRVRRVPLIESP